MNYFSDAAAANQNHPDLHEQTGAGLVAVAYGWKTCLLSSFTTMLGMGSLVTSQRSGPAFRHLLGCGLGVATVVLLLTFPQFTTWLCNTKRNRIGDDVHPSDSPPLKRIGLSDHFQTKLVAGLSRYSTFEFDDARSACAHVH